MFSLVMIGGFSVIVYLGPFALILLVSFKNSVFTYIVNKKKSVRERVDICNVHDEKASCGYGF